MKFPLAKNLGEMDFWRIPLSAKPGDQHREIYNQLTLSARTVTAGNRIRLRVGGCGVCLYSYEPATGFVGVIFPDEHRSAGIGHSRRYQDRLSDMISRLWRRQSIEPTHV